MRARGAISALVATAALALAGCSASQPAASAPVVDDGQVRLYGSDGNMADSFGQALRDKPGVLDGMKGTVPLTPLTDDFKQRLRALDRSIPDFNYAGESYDAVMVGALAAEAAHTTDPVTVARYVVAVTVGRTACTTYRACVTLLRAGHPIAYRGVSSLRRSGFSDRGDPSTASYAALNFGQNNAIDEAKTEYVGAGDQSGQATTAPPLPAGHPGARVPALKFGGLLPHTGALALNGPPLFDGARLAVQEINGDGGVLGQPVEWLDGDDGTSTTVASATVDRFIGSGVQIIIGASASGISRAVLPRVIAARRIMISPSATADSLSTLDDKGLFFRTAPPDRLQAKALADILMRDGVDRVAIVARDDDYGLGLAKAVQADLVAAGVRAGDVRTLSYRAKDAYGPADQAALFQPLATDVKAGRADAVLIIGYDESALFVRALKTAGVAFRS
jgi:ABC-type branched-subunit amino acid transport system substrate-binding protein